MDYVIELKKPEGSAVFHKGACFELSFSKVRGREPESTNFIATLDEDAKGCLSFSVDHTAFEVSADITVLRAIGEASKLLPQRSIAGKIGWSTGKTNKVIQKLVKEGLLEKDRAGTRITDHGRYTLHEVFPNRFDPPPNPERFIIPF